MEKKKDFRIRFIVFDNFHTAKPERDKSGSFDKHDKVHLLFNLDTHDDITKPQWEICAHILKLFTFK